MTLFIGMGNGKAGDDRRKGLMASFLSGDAGMPLTDTTVPDDLI